MHIYVYVCVYIYMVCVSSVYVYLHKLVFVYMQDIRIYVDAVIYHIEHFLVDSRLYYEIVHLMIYFVIMNLYMTHTINNESK